jgi:hypothetical protein
VGIDEHAALLDVEGIAPALEDVAIRAISVRKTSSDTSTSRSSRNVFFSRSSTIYERTDISCRLLVGRIRV